MVSVTGVNLRLLDMIDILVTTQGYLVPRGDSENNLICLHSGCLSDLSVNIPDRDIEIK